VKRGIRTPLLVCQLLLRFIEFFHPVAIFEDFARLGAVGRTDDAVFFHKVDQARGAAVTDAQAALQCGSGSTAGVANDSNGVLIEVVVDILAAVSIGAISPIDWFAIFVFRRFEEFFLVFR